MRLILLKSLNSLACYQLAIMLTVASFRSRHSPLWLFFSGIPALSAKCFTEDYIFHLRMKRKQHEVEILCDECFLHCATTSPRTVSCSSTGSSPHMCAATHAHWRHQLNLTGNTFLFVFDFIPQDYQNAKSCCLKFVTIYLFLATQSVHKVK